MATYSFANVTAAITGPGGGFNLGNGAGASEEGISISMVEDKDTMTIGADGSVMHSLHAGKGGTVTVRLLKTSPTNARLQDLYNFQQQSSANWGNNTIVVRDPVRGDVATCRQCAFRRQPDLTYAKEGGVVEWSFNAGMIDEILGVGTPEIL
ncbi:hypothetical protein GGR16_002411 [Chelatococcus caeni]|uniref:DUF3277 domain-containing protein n=1 Tax=Chelatococcus caeni TaxID=1348468 RepID=A0A840C087_9HYPH|nr:DUF3277 family protein [Chelatococcus caeni]MBB4017382.1 hypothetical protein [Chelatococcus caeni]